MATSELNEESFHLVTMSQLFLTKREQRLCHFLIKPLQEINRIRNVFPVSLRRRFPQLRYLLYVLRDHKCPPVHALTWECLIVYMTGDHRCFNCVHGSNSHQRTLFAIAKYLSSICLFVNSVCKFHGNIGIS